VAVTPDRKIDMIAPEIDQAARRQKADNQPGLAPKVGKRGDHQPEAQCRLARDDQRPWLPLRVEILKRARQLGEQIS